jgi:hypothetical protein|tara:strand:+ start:203 stop:739 length:537 start_codon:yes stop_codon:yes gene_type:complete
MSIDSLAGEVCVDDKTGHTEMFIQLSDDYCTQLEMFDQEEFAKYHAGEESKLTDDEALRIEKLTNSYREVTLVFVKESWSYKVISREMWEIIQQREMHYQNAFDEGAITDVTDMLQGFRATSKEFNPLFDSQERMCVFTGDVSSNIGDCCNHSLYNREDIKYVDVMTYADMLPDRMID